MKLYNGIIEETLSLLSVPEAKETPYNSSKCWKDAGESQLIMRREAAFELGGSGQPSLNYTCVTSSGLITEDKVIRIGPDLQEITADTPFARIALLEVGELGEDEEAHTAIRELEFVRYHIYPRGYMVRVSSTSNQEQVRCGGAALRAGMSFEYIGNAYIRKYKKLPVVKHAALVFITDKALVEKLEPFAGRVDGITKTLTHILDGLPTDCGHCSMKTVCDEVDGMREEHMARAKRQAEAAGR